MASEMDPAAPQEMTVVEVAQTLFVARTCPDALHSKAVLYLHARATAAETARAAAEARVKELEGRRADDAEAFSITDAQSDYSFLKIERYESTFRKLERALMALSTRVQEPELGRLRDLILVDLAYEPDVPEAAIFRGRLKAAEAQAARLREASKRLLHVVGHSVSLVPTGNGSTEWRYIGDPAALAGAFANFPALTQPSSQERKPGTCRECGATRVEGHKPECSMLARECPHCGSLDGGHTMVCQAINKKPSSQEDAGHGDRTSTR